MSYVKVSYIRVAYILVIVCCAFAGLIATTVYGAETPALRADSILVYTNIERYSRGLPLLRTSAQLSKVAERKMRDMFARQYFAHEAPTGEDVSDLADGVGYAYLAVGENLAMGDFTSSKHVVRSWMESTGHRENILAGKYSEIGIAAGRGSYKGNSIWMVVQSFGTPRSSCPVVDEALRKTLSALRMKLTMLDQLLVLREERARDTSLSKKVREERILEYNKTVKLYNEYVANYREKLRVYNSAVDAFNACLTEKVGE
ncbi:MAG: CAP domain-containing protein [Candidatus Pacebacteria bacterium]|nr:CAP domain-containing protein [Candidatus Paceibacterota bacterium]